jgi:lipopolysaccharide export LptBFGC system permease protein LptF
MEHVSPHVFEMVMLVCFGCSWPFAIAKTIRTKTVVGKSIIFITLIFIGYLSGIIFKLVGNFDHVIWLYVTNGSLVFTEIVLYFKYNRSGSRRRENDTKPRLRSMRRTKIVLEGEG